MDSAHGGFGVGVGGLCASDVILLAQAYLSVPEVMTGALLRPARPRCLFAIFLDSRRRPVGDSVAFSISLRNDNLLSF